MLHVYVFFVVNFLCCTAGCVCGALYCEV